MQGPAIWNNFVTNIEKELGSGSLFKWKGNIKLLDFENEFFNKAKVIFVLYSSLWVKLDTWPLNWLPTLKDEFCRKNCKWIGLRKIYDYDYDYDYDYHY